MVEIAKEELIPMCKFDNEGMLVCTPKVPTSDGVVTTKTPMKFHVDGAGKITMVDSGDAPDWLIDKMLRHLEKNLIIKK